MFRDTLERQSLNFYAYAKRQAPADPDEDFFFSDVVPVASTDPTVASQALYHTLALASKCLIKVRQDEAYGEVSGILSS